MSSPSRLGRTKAAELLKCFPREPSRSLARILYRDNVEIYSCYSSAYSAIRTLRGANGVHNRKSLIASGDTSMMFPPLIPCVEMPEPKTVDWTPAYLDGERFLCISDVHLPYHDSESLQIVFSDAKKANIDSILINGDLMDSYQLSNFAKSPTKPRFSEEVDTAKQFLSYMRQEFPKAVIHWKFGNHDLSLERYFWVKAPELFGCPGTDLEDFVDAQSYGIHIIKDNRPVMLGKLTALHGHEWGGGSIGPVNPARGAFLKLNDSAIISHFHRSSQHSESTVHGKLITCWSMGCLCRLHPEYARINKWNSGYAIVSVDKEGGFEVDNRRVYQGRSW